MQVFDGSCFGMLDTPMNSVRRSAVILCKRKNEKLPSRGSCSPTLAQEKSARMRHPELLVGSMPSEVN